ncbi:hypothetical protein Tco_0445181 [Tanacetum coccineum]
MNHIATQQAALDNALVPSEKRLKIKRCNARIAFNKPQREETYQVTLEALKLSPCYLAFLITAEVPEIYMHQFWNTITKIRDTYAYSFKLDKKKCRVDTEELGYSGKCNMLSAIHTDQMHQPWRTFAAIINRKLSPILEAEPVKKAKRVKRPAKKSTYASIDDVIIRDTPGVSVSKKKAHAKGDGVGSQPKVPDDFKDKTTGADEGTGTKPGVPDVPTYESDSDNESENGDDDGNDVHDSEQTDSDDDDENPFFTLKDYDEEEHDEEYESDDDYENVYKEEDDDLYKDVDMRSLGAEYEKERKGDKEMTDADRNVLGLMFY